jgi:hypothetical protein
MVIYITKSVKRVSLLLFFARQEERFGARRRDRHSMLTLAHTTRAIPLRVGTLPVPLRLPGIAAVTAALRQIAALAGPTGLSTGHHCVVLPVTRFSLSNGFPIPPVAIVHPSCSLSAGCRRRTSCDGLACLARFFPFRCACAACGFISKEKPCRPLHIEQLGDVSLE